MGDGGELVRVTRERDLYLRLLRRGDQVELEPFLREALTLIVEAVSALHGYLELHDDRGGPGWWIAHGLSPEQVAGVRHAISRGILARPHPRGPGARGPPRPAVRHARPALRQPRERTALAHRSRPVRAHRGRAA